MREYNRLRSEKQKRFTYQDLAPVYLFIIMEDSPKAFRDVPAYIHRRQVSYDSGVLLPGIEHITYISLDKFRETVHHIGNELDAWLTFFSTTEPRRIIELVDRYPAFADYYRDIALFRRNPKELINMFSEALYIMDRNAERLMVDELRQEVQQAREEISAKDIVIRERELALSKKDQVLSEKDLALSEKDQALSEKDLEIQKLKEQLSLLQASNHN